MIAATSAVQRPADAKLLVISAEGGLRELRRAEFVSCLERGDLVVANDAATLPASLTGLHLLTGSAIEVRLAGRRTLAPDDVANFSAVVFGAGDFHTPTEHRPPPPPLTPGDTLLLGPLRATVSAMLGHPRLVSIHFDGPPETVWRGLAAHGRPIQYAHLAQPLALFDVWTAIAGRPVAFEPPSAGFILDWEAIRALHERGIHFATITHAAGISSTGDDTLDALLPFDEPYTIPAATARAIAAARREGRRIVAIGTTVVRALEHAAAARDGRIRAGDGVASGRIGKETPLRVVNVIISGVHEPATSHYQLLRAFAPDAVLERADKVMEQRGFLTHEFGDSVLIERAREFGLHAAV